MEIDLGIYVTFPGVLQPLQVLGGVVELLCLVPIGCARTGGDGLVMYAAGGAVIFTLARVGVELIDAPLESARRHLWLVAAMIYTAIWTLLYFVSVWFCVAGWVSTSCGWPYFIAAFFCVCSFGAYSLDCLYNFREWRIGNVSATSNLFPSEGI